MRLDALISGGAAGAASGRPSAQHNAGSLGDSAFAGLLEPAQLAPETATPSTVANTPAQGEQLAADDRSPMVGLGLPGFETPAPTTTAPHKTSTQAAIVSPAAGGGSPGVATPAQAAVTSAVTTDDATSNASRVANAQAAGPQTVTNTTALASQTAQVPTAQAPTAQAPTAQAPTAQANPSQAAMQQASGPTAGAEIAAQHQALRTSARSAIATLAPAIAKTAAAQDRSGEGGWTSLTPVTTSAPLSSATPFAALPSAAPNVPVANAEQLAMQLQLQLRDGVQKATVRLHPESLGELQVSVETAEHQVRVVVTARQPEAVEWLQQGSSRLHASLDAAGFSDVDVDVRQDFGGGDQQARDWDTLGQDARPGGLSGDDTLTQDPQPERRVTLSTGLDGLDTWA